MKKYSKSTLSQLPKKELVDYIYMLYHNLEAIDEAYENATNYYRKEVAYKNEVSEARKICDKVIVRISETIVLLNSDENIDKLFIDNEFVNILNSILSISAICRKDNNL